MPIKRLASIRAASSKARKRRIRSEERRVGEERRSRGAPYHLKKKKKNAGGGGASKNTSKVTYVSTGLLCVERELPESCLSVRAGRLSFCCVQRLVIVTLV